jgi:aspartyl-tRNA(Asn)/glutamyl-tRNA(Gln) amidotransferase subunit A
MTRTVRDAALLLNATAGADPRDRNSWSSGVDYLSALEAFDPKGLRVAWSPDLGYAPVDPDVREATASAARRFEELGCHVEEIDPGLPDPWEVVDVIWSSGMAALHKDDFDQVKDVIDQGRRATIERGFALRALDLASAYLDRSRYYQSWRQIMERYDLLLTPSLPCTAFAVGLDFPPFIDGKPMTYLGWTAFTYPFNLTGQPAATVPCGFDGEGLPIGLQIVGRWRDDASVLGASAAFEALAPWAGRRPPV